MQAADDSPCECQFLVIIISRKHRPIVVDSFSTLGGEIGYSGEFSPTIPLEVGPEIAPAEIEFGAF